jgi:hypothetical protein
MHRYDEIARARSDELTARGLAAYAVRRAPRTARAKGDCPLAAVARRLFGRRDAVPAAH